jgi:hypothetical protein
MLDLPNSTNCLQRPADAHVRERSEKPMSVVETVGDDCAVVAGESR